MLFYFFGGSFYDAVHFLSFGYCKPKMPARDCQFAVLGHIAKAFHSGVVAGRFQKPEMIFRPYVVEHHSGNLKIFVEILKKGNPVSAQYQWV